jgi:hypothetical protein
VIEKEDIMGYIEDAPAKKVKQLAMTLTAMMSPDQLKVLDSRFKKKVEFEPVKPKPKKQKPTKEEEEEAVEEEEAPAQPKEEEDPFDGLDLD